MRPKQPKKKHVPPERIGFLKKHAHEIEVTFHKHLHSKSSRHEQILPRWIENGIAMTTSWFHTNSFQTCIDGEVGGSDKNDAVTIL